MLRGVSLQNFQIEPSLQKLTTSAEKFGFNEKSRKRLSSLEQWAWHGKRTPLSGPAKGDHEQSGRFYQKQSKQQIPGTKIDW